jgi:glucan phosphorylase
LKKFAAFADDKATQTALMKVKKDNKIAFAKYVKEAYDIEIDPNFDL